LVAKQIQISRASQRDAALLSELSTVTFSDTFKDTCTAEDMRGFIHDYFSVEQIEKELKDENDFYFIAYADGKPAGYLRIKEEESEVEIIRRHKSIELKRIYVEREFLSQKIGAALMKFALAFAQENKYELIWLGVWEHNEKAKTFYNKFGFIDSGVRHPFPIGTTPQTDVWLYRLI
jgi:diamine N-acetyltransferase